MVRLGMATSCVWEVVICEEGGLYWIIDLDSQQMVQMVQPYIYCKSLNSGCLSSSIINFVLHPVFPEDDVPQLKFLIALWKVLRSTCDYDSIYGNHCHLFCPLIYDLCIHYFAPTFCIKKNGSLLLIWTWLNFVNGVSIILQPPCRSLTVKKKRASVSWIFHWLSW